MRYALWFVAQLVAGASPSPARPPEWLAGRVVATHTGTPLADATVRVDGVARVARTDSLGEFVLDGVPAGAVTVRTRRIGFYAGHGTVRRERALRIEVGLDPVLTCLDACTTEPAPTPGDVRAIR